jgi:hypothetical protein
MLMKNDKERDLNTIIEGKTTDGAVSLFIKSSIRPYTETQTRLDCVLPPEAHLMVMSPIFMPKLSCEYLILLVSNAEIYISDTKGDHWSLITLDVLDRACYYFDSMEGFNTQRE